MRFNMRLVMHVNAIKVGILGSDATYALVLIVTIVLVSLNHQLITNLALRVAAKHKFMGSAIWLLDNILAVVEVAHVTMVVHRVEDVGSTMWAGTLHRFIRKLSPLVI